MYPKYNLIDAPWDVKDSAHFPPFPQVFTTRISHGRHGKTWARVVTPVSPGFHHKPQGFFVSLLEKIIVMLVSLRAIGHVQPSQASTEQFSLLEK